LTKKDVPALKQKVFDIIYNDLKADVNQTSWAFQKFYLQAHHRVLDYPLINS
jgi:hypothetical protein